MQHIGFILWMTLYPIASAITGYLGAKQRKIEGKEPYDNGTTAFAALVNIIIWASVGKALFNCA